LGGDVDDAPPCGRAADDFAAREELDLVLERAILGCFSAALRTLFTMFIRLSGFSTKS
jgi:hypothetical protein